VDLLELMGDEIYVYMMSGKHDLVARVDPRSKYAVGQKAQVAFDMSKMHIFDVEKNPDNPVAIR
jgi:multiple sugar transport system ATP-binding protein